MSQTEFIKYIRTPEFKELLKKYEEAVNSGVHHFIDSEDLVDIAEYYHFMGMPERAEVAVDYCLEISPDCPIALYFKARTALTDYDDADTAEYYMSQLPAEEESLEKTYILAEIMICRGEFEAANSLLMSKYDKLKEQVEEKEQEEDLSSVYEIDDEDDDANFLLEDYRDYPIDVAMVFCDHGQPSYAEQWMKRLDSPLEDMRFEYWETWGRIYTDSGRHEKAIEAWNKAIDIDAYNVNAWIQLSNSQYMQECFADSLQSVNYALAIEPKHAEAMQMKGACLYSLNRLDEAMEWFQYYNEVYPDDPQADIYIGALYFEKKDANNGMEHFGIAMEKAEYDTEIIAKVALMLCEFNCTQYAFNLLSKVADTLIEEQTRETCTGMFVEVLLQCCKDLGKQDEYSKYKEFFYPSSFK